MRSAGAVIPIAGSRAPSRPCAFTRRAKRRGRKRTSSTRRAPNVSYGTSSRSRSAASAAGSRTNTTVASTPARRSAPASSAVSFSAPPTFPSQRTKLSCIASVRASARYDDRKRSEEQADVVPQRPVRHVQVVELHHLLEWDVGATEHLPDARDARREVEPAAAPAADHLVLGLDQRPRPHEAHLALEDVPELGELVEAQMPQAAPDARDARVVLEVKPVRIDAVGEELRSARLRVHVHRPELEDVEAPAALADAALSEEHGTGRVELDRDRDGDEQWQENHDQRESAGEVEGTLERARRPAEHRWVDAQQGDALDVVDLDGRAERVEDLGEEAHLQHEPLAAPDRVDHL